jgi:hypothetical protein
MKFFIFFALFIFFTISVYSQKVRPILDFTTALYIPYSEVKYDINFGLINNNNKGITSILSLGLGVNKGYTINLKGVFIFNKMKIGKLSPLVLTQIKLNNLRTYNVLTPNPGNVILYFKNSLISQIGIQTPFFMDDLNLNIQSGLSYNFQKTIDENLIIFPKLYTDTRINFINSISIVKKF